jgi:hypothetical protein
MTAIIYFGEMLVASLVATVLLVISRLSMSTGAVLFGGGVVAWTLAEYIVHRCCTISRRENMGCIMPTLMERSSRFFGRYGFVSRWSISSREAFSWRAR